MAKGGRVGFWIDYEPFLKSCQAAIDRVERGTKKATIQACEEIKEMTLAEVPRDTTTLAESFFYDVQGSYRNFSATIGYGGNGDPVNPRTQQPASQYMVAVHEDLNANHPNGGKAKFLEDPVREYQRSKRFINGVADAINSELR
jgi:hypothetical protein